MVGEQTLQELICGVGQKLTNTDFTNYLLGLIFPRMKIGTYTGDAAATKAITGVGFKPTLLVIYEKVDAKAVGIKTSIETTGAFIIASGVNVYNADLIISLDADGFTVGDGTGSANYMNEAQAYVYVAFG